MESHTTEILLRWIVLVPLLGAAINGLLNRRLPRQVAGLLACTAVGISFALSVTVFLRLTGMAADARFVSDIVTTWIGLVFTQHDSMHICYELCFALKRIRALSPTLLMIQFQEGALLLSVQVGAQDAQRIMMQYLWQSALVLRP